MLPASPGLSVYYEGVLAKLENSEELETLDNDNNEDVYDDLLEEMESDSDLIH
jgi:hypothetical protein